MARFALFTALVLSLLLAGACMKLERPPLERTLYGLEAQRSGGAEQAPASAPVLRVRRVAVSPLYDGRSLVYKTHSGEYESDFYNQFFVQPADLLSQVLRQWLGASGLYSHVLDPASVVRANQLLEPSVVSLYGDYSGDQPAAVVEMQFLLLDEDGSTQEVLLANTYSRRIPLEAATPKALTAGFATAVAQIYADLERDMTKVQAGR